MISETDAEKGPVTAPGPAGKGMLMCELHATNEPSNV